MTILADIESGNVDLADILFLIAVILFAIGAVMSAMARVIDLTLVRAGFACVALGFLVL